MGTCAVASLGPLSLTSIGLRMRTSAHLTEGGCPFPGHSRWGPGGRKAMALYDFNPNTETESGGALSLPVS